MKIIFLDIDGVLNHSKSKVFIENGCLKELKRICQRTKAKIVMISSWKEVFLKDSYKDRPERKMFEKIFTKKNSMELVGVTKNLGDGDNRVLEVLDYLENHKRVNSFVILDDVNYGYREVFGEKYIQTDWNNGGLVVEKAEKAIYVLNKGEV